MPIAVVCPFCNSKMRAPDKLAGKNIKCPRCGSSIRAVDKTIAKQGRGLLKYAIAAVAIPLIVTVIGGLAVEYLKPRGAPENAGLGSEANPASPGKPAPPTVDEIVAKVKKSADIDLVSVPAGDFYMGSKPDDKDAFPEEKPRHKVRITKPFYLGKYMVTVGQFARFIEATGTRTEAEKEGDKATWKKPGFDQTNDHPVVCVSWNNADAFCRWLAKEAGAAVRLPREAQWEYACRAGTTTRFYFGDNQTDLGQYAWYKGNSNNRTHPCGLKMPNDFGLYDMHGLVWEWCFDGKRTYRNREETDPEGPTGVGDRVIRGGTAFYDPPHCRAAYRDHPGDGQEPSSRSDHIGFRVFASR